MTEWLFDYRMELRFSMPVSRHTFMLRFYPHSDGRQTVRDVRVETVPAILLPWQTDSFGNGNACGHIEERHSEISLRVKGRAEIRSGGCVGPGSAIWAMPTRLTRDDGTLRALGDGLAVDDPLRLAQALTERIRERVVYMKGITGDSTTALEAWSMGGGVCQDMAQLLIGALRARGVPARYVAGLIPGEGETHAWVEVMCDGVWYGYDPTALQPTDERYLCVNRGRDSADCAINRGVFTGTALQTMHISAIMEPNG